MPGKVTKVLRDLTAPYADIPSLKERAENDRAENDPASISAAPTVTSDWAGGAPTSRLVILAKTAPGSPQDSAHDRAWGLCVRDRHPEEHHHDEEQRQNQDSQDG